MYKQTSNFNSNMNKYLMKWYVEVNIDYMYIHTQC